MKHTDNDVAFTEVWASLRQPGSQWVTELLVRNLQSNSPRIPIDNVFRPLPAKRLKARQATPSPKQFKRLLNTCCPN